MTKGGISPGTPIHDNFQLAFNCECFLICKGIFNFVTLCPLPAFITCPQWQTHKGVKKTLERQRLLLWQLDSLGWLQRWSQHGWSGVWWLWGELWDPFGWTEEGKPEITPCWGWQLRVGMKGGGGTCLLNWDLTFYSPLGGVELTALCLLGFRFSSSEVPHGQDGLGDVTQVSGMWLSCSIPLSGFIPGGFK